MCLLFLKKDVLKYFPVCSCAELPYWSTCALLPLNHTVAMTLMLVSPPLWSRLNYLNMIFIRQWTKMTLVIPDLFSCATMRTVWNGGILCAMKFWSFVWNTWLDLHTICLTLNMNSSHFGRALSYQWASSSGQKLSVCKTWKSDDICLPQVWLMFSIVSIKLIFSFQTDHLVSRC